MATNNKDDNQSTSLEQVEPSTTIDKESTKGKSSNSTQFQLLNIANQFCISGTLKPADKQPPIEERMLKRERFNHLRKQANLEAIIEKSVKYCSAQDAGNKADPDWFSNFVELAENVSNTTMQDLWAKILAGELSHPGSFSVKALQTFKHLTIYDAKLLAKACSLAVKDKSKRNIRLISGCYQKPGIFNLLDKQREVNVSLSQYGIGYSEILTLADNNLLFAQETELSPMRKGEELALKHNGTPFILSAKRNNVILKFYKFTPIGAELAQLIAEKPDPSLFDVLKAGINYHFNAHS